MHSHAVIEFGSDRMADKNRCVTPNGRTKMQLYLAFLRLTTPIPGKGCSCPRNMQLYLAFSRSTTPIHDKNRCVTPNGRKKMQLYPAFVRSTTPIQVRVARDTGKVSFYDAFARWTRPIHGKGCIPDGGVGAGSGFRKNI